MDVQDVKKAELVGLKIMKASELIQDAAGALFRQNGLSAPQYNVLRILRGAGPQGLNCQEISGRMIKRVPDITRLLDRLEEKSLVARARSSRDRRVVISTVTPAGLDLLHGIDAPLDRQVAGNFEPLDPEELEALAALLDRLLARLDS